MSLGHLENREWMVASLVEEIFGPGGQFSSYTNDLYGAITSIEIKEGYVFESREEYEKKHIQQSTGQEILTGTTPTRQYGIGILHPILSDSTLQTQSVVEEVDISTSEEQEDEIADKYKKEIIKLTEGKEISENKFESRDLSLDGDDGEFSDLQYSRIRRPSSMGISFVTDISEGAPIKVQLSGARYVSYGVAYKYINKKENSEKTSEQTAWLRVPIAEELEFTFSAEKCIKKISIQTHNLPDLELEVSLISRPEESGGHRCTIVLINRSKYQEPNKIDKFCLFQSRFVVTPYRGNISANILAYREITGRKMDEEEESLALLYRNSRTFAIGHGCSGDWIAEESATKAQSVIAEPIPVFKMPPVTANIPGSTIDLSILPLASLHSEDRGVLKPLRELKNAYKDWIEIKTSEVDKLDKKYETAARRHIVKAKEILSRIELGLTLLEKNDKAWYAFRLTNRAMLLQYLAGSMERREISISSDNRKIFSSAYCSPVTLIENNDKRALNRKWYPFQIAFLLMNIQGIWEEAQDDRKTVDLIWFPTGGGKTEAYLATTAFLLLTRRLKDKSDSGTGVLMRYTLRLLTAQQFQRASSLICALEYIRKKDSTNLGKGEFKIGIWVGEGTTPNTHANSVASFRQVQNDNEDKYKHVILKCPWCGASIGPRRDKHKFVLDGLRVCGLGNNRKVVIHCSDNTCNFSEALPISVVDEEIYENPPSLLIGTVDKFAMLAWKPEARSIFGITNNGSRLRAPPSLIIQDELHLITGPLGSMVGLYEGLIEKLCTSVSGVPPKIIAATATTRAASQQIRDLYARENISVFPAPGLSADDSFFAKHDRDENGKLKEGRMYVGILARGYNSALTVSVRTFSSLLAAGKRISGGEEKDPWWTLLIFYNSLRELGAELTLFAADIPSRLENIHKRWGIDRKDARYLKGGKTIELTGRLSNSDIPKAIKFLEQKYQDDSDVKKQAIDVCLASNIIEVGVDVSRLGVMAINGQPKTMAQYIQATGRVGRQKPGLVFMLYNAGKSRDLSHYEHFRSDHERMYALVEPSSVTPFTLPVLERALHGILIAWCRQFMNRDLRVEFSDKIKEKIDECREYLLRRVQILYSRNPSEAKYASEIVNQVVDKRINEWKSNVSVTEWSVSSEIEHNQNGNQPLMRSYGASCPLSWERCVWETPTSVRGVDAECIVSY